MLICHQWIHSSFKQKPKNTFWWSTWCSRFSSSSHLLRLAQAVIVVFCDCWEDQIRWPWSPVCSLSQSERIESSSLSKITFLLCVWSMFLYFSCLSENQCPVAAHCVLAGSLGFHPLGLPLLLDGQQTPQLLQLWQPCRRFALAADQDANLLLPACLQLLASPLSGHAELWLVNGRTTFDQDPCWLEELLYSNLLPWIVLTGLVQLVHTPNQQGQGHQRYSTSLHQRQKWEQ